MDSSKNRFNQIVKNTYFAGLRAVCHFLVDKTDNQIIQIKLLFFLNGKNFFSTIITKLGLF